MSVSPSRPAEPTGFAELPAERAAEQRTADPRAMNGTREGWLIGACERGLIPDRLVRAGMRTLMRERLRDEHAHDGERRAEAFARLLAELRASPIAIDTQAANAQHYELPNTFFDAHLGPHLKYSCGYYPRGDETLAEGETAMLELYAQRAELADGQHMLDLGCGWGSLSLWLAARYPRAQIVALSNSAQQRAFIEARCRERHLTNLRVVTGNIVDFDFTGTLSALRGERGFDRVLSVEMFEHMKHYGLLLAKIAGWLALDGKLFVHHFAHPVLAYHFENRDGTDWMSRYFFTGGTMPSASLLLHFQDHLRVTREWWVSGRHYERTANQWLASLDAARERVRPMFVETYGARDAARWFQRWRMFYMAVAELFGYAGGSEWGVAHLLLERRAMG